MKLWNYQKCFVSDFRVIVGITILFYFSILDSFSQPANDDCFTSQQICFGSTISGTTVAATPDINVSPSCFPSTNSVWYNLQTVSQAGDLSVDISNLVAVSGNGTYKIAIFSGNNCNNLNEIACEPNVVGPMSVTATGLTANTNIWILVDGDTAGGINTQGTFDISISGSAVVPSATLDLKQATCNYKTRIRILNTVFSNTPYGYSLNGSVPQVNPIYDNMPPGNYTVTVSNSVGCTFNLSTVISQDSIITFSSNTNPADCNLQNGSINITGVSGGTGSFTFSANGSTPSNSSSFNNLAAGTYNVTISDGICDTLIRVFVSSNSGIQSAQGASGLASCNGADGQISYPINSILGATPPLQFSLSGPGGTQNNASGSFLNLAQGTYTVTITDNNGAGCAYLDEVTVSQLPPPVPSAINTVPDNCKGNNGVLQLSGFGGIPPYLFSVNGGPSQVSPTFSKLSAGSYSIKVTDSNGCSSSSTANVSFALGGISTKCSAGPGTEIFQGEATKFNPEIPPGSTIEWTPPIGIVDITKPNTSVAPNSTTNYSILVTETNGCTCTSNVTIVVKKLLKLYNVFTPNGDGINDVWPIDYVENYDNVEVDIYDRYGLKVFHSTGYSAGQEWDGNSAIGKLPTSVYYYVVKYNFKGENKDYFQSGSVTLVR